MQVKVKLAGTDNCFNNNKKKELRLIEQSPFPSDANYEMLLGLISFLRKEIASNRQNENMLLPEMPSLHICIIHYTLY